MHGAKISNWLGLGGADQLQIMTLAELAQLVQMVIVQRHARLTMDAKVLHATEVHACFIPTNPLARQTKARSLVTNCLNRFEFTYMYMSTG